MKYISKAPFRIGLAGGGTDVSPFSDKHGGRVLNATVDLYATTVLIPRKDNQVVFKARNQNIEIKLEAKSIINNIPELSLQIGVYNHMVKNFSKTPLACEIITDVDVPTGSGLGTSSTLVVSIIGAFMEWLNLPLGEYDIAQIAVNIERYELNMVGGKQDQYAATFGGFNFMEFYSDNKVIVNPLRIKSEIIRELNYHLLLFYTQTVRQSSKIIEVQKNNFNQEISEVLEASHHLKEQAISMKNALLMGALPKISKLLNIGWENKKLLAKGISNNQIEDIYYTAMQAGAFGGKISGAGGGGFIMFYCPMDTRFKVIDALKKKGVLYQKYNFQKKGLETWTSKQ